MSYETWAANHAAGIAAARAKTDARRLRGQALADRRRMMRERHPCKVRGCTRTAYKGAICKGHWDTIPQKDKVELVIASIMAQKKVADRFHARFLRRLNAEARAG